MKVFVNLRTRFPAQILQTCELLHAKNLQLARIYARIAQIFAQNPLNCAYLIPKNRVFNTFQQINADK